MIYVTDVESGYFTRDEDPGSFTLWIGGRTAEEIGLSYSVNLWNGVANLKISLPQGVQAGDLLSFQSKVTDPSRVEPFVSEFWVEIVPTREKTSGTDGRHKPPSSQNGRGEKHSSQLALPQIVEVRRKGWEEHGFDEYSALRVKGDDESGYVFYVNFDNKYLLTEAKHRHKVDPRLLEAQFSYGLVLIGMALLREDLMQTEEDEEEMDVFKEIRRVTRAIAPTLLPMITSLGDLEPESAMET